MTLVGTLASDAFADGDYHLSCTESRIVDLGRSKLLVASCKRRDGSINTHTNILLELFIANDDGSMVWRRNGGFASTCVLPSLEGSKLRALCRKRDGSGVVSTIDLDENIANYDGKLEYVGP
ncbi:MAG TPA: CVNH domain-containing protein [Polyangium sp.]|nr:CVNH domain-containing protein [Polyangium sp.]